MSSERSELRAFSEFEFYSPIHDARCIRVSVGDGQGGEFYVILKNVGYGRSLREARARALNAIESAMDSGLLPGEVQLSND